VGGPSSADRRIEVRTADGSNVFCRIARREAAEKPNASAPVVKRAPPETSAGKTPPITAHEASESAAAMASRSSPG